jgi:acyl-CoA dehydrogenase
MTTGLAASRAAGVETAARHAEDVDARARFPREAFATLKEHKLLGLLVPVRDGGAGASLADIVSVCHALGQACASTAMIYAMHQIQVWCIVRHGADSTWHRAFLRRLASEQLLMASATSEAGIGGDVRSSICAVEEKDGRFAFEKQATVISYGADADGIMATARRTPQSPASDQVIVVLPKSSYRLEHLQSWDTLGMRGTCSDGYRLQASGEIAQIVPMPYADVSAQTMLPTSHLVWSAVWLGIASDAVARARAFIRAEARRNAGTVPIGATRLAEAAQTLKVMRSGLRDSLRQYEAALAEPDQLQSPHFAVAMNNLKIGSSRLVVEVVNQAMLACGLNGYRNDSPFSLSRHLRDAHSAQLMVNNDRILANTARLQLALREEPELFQ